MPVPFSPTFSYYFHVSLSPVGRLLLRHPQNRSNLSSSKSSQWKLSTLARGWRNWPRTSRACAGSAAAPASPLAVRRRSRRAAAPAYQCLRAGQYLPILLLSTTVLKKLASYVCDSTTYVLHTLKFTSLGVIANYLFDGGEANTYSIMAPYFFVGNIFS